MQTFSHVNLTAKELVSTELDLIVIDALKLFNVPGASIGIVINDDIVHSSGYGICKVGSIQPVTKDTLFPIASCTKAFTAYLMGLLAEEGKLSLDDPVQKYIPEFALLDLNLAAKITIRDLLAHRTGMARHDALWVCLNHPKSRLLELLKYLEPACGWREEFQYNNLMYGVAGIVVEVVTGRSWEEALIERVLMPLGLYHTTPHLETMKLSHNYAFPHAELNGVLTTIPFCYNMSLCRPGGSLNSNITDMIKWIQFQLNSHGSKQLDEMYTVQIPFLESLEWRKNLFFSGYGLGWFIGKCCDHHIIWHGGNIDGFASSIMLFPKEKIGIAILVNSSTDGSELISYIHNHIMNWLFDNTQEEVDLPKIIDQRTALKQKLQAAVETFEADYQCIHSLSEMQDYIGEYKHPAYGNFSVRFQEGRMVADFGNETLPLVFKDRDHFVSQYANLLIYRVDPFMDLTFIRNDQGVVTHLSIPLENFRSAKPIVFMREKP